MAWARTNMVDQIQPEVARQLDRLIASLQRMREERQQHAVLVTGVGAPGLKTSTAIQLATALADSGSRVMLIDGDWQCPAIHALLQVPRDPGIGEAAAEPIPAWPVREVANGVSLLTAGTAAPGSAAARVDVVVPQVLATVGRDFDWVIIDAPCVGGRDAAALVRLVPAVVFVIDARVAYRGVSDALAALPVGSRVGTVLRSA